MQTAAPLSGLWPSSFKR